MKAGITRIEIFGQNDEYICVHSPDSSDAGNRGIWLGEDQVHGIYTSPMKQTWKSGARSIGAKQRNKKILARDMDLGFMVRETATHTAEENESYLIQAIGEDLDDYDEDAHYARLRIVTDLSGWRDLDIVQYEEPDFSPKRDPIKDQFFNPILKIRSGNPDWFEDDVVEPAVFTSGGWGEIIVENPTPRVMLHKWICTVGTWTLPDFSWLGSKGKRRPGGKWADRMIACPPITANDGGMTIDLDLQKLMARSANGTNLLPRFGGKAFLHPIPPYTQRQTLPVYVEDVPANGAMVQLIQPRRWPRPWGGELRA